MITKIKKNPTPWLWAGAVLFGITLLFARVVFPETLWATIVSSVLFIASVTGLIILNRQAVSKKTAAHGLNSLMTAVLVISIVGVVNFLSIRYPQKLDLTKNKVNTLSDQTIKVVKGLNQPVKAVFFGTVEQREQNKVLLENYKALNPKFEIEYVDPNKEVTRAKQAGIKAMSTLQLIVGTRDQKVEAPTEEKLTNALIKMLKDKAPLVCNITQHGEKDFNSNAADGFEAAKKVLQNQSYEIKDLNLIAEGKIPESCSMISILGPNKALFDAETKLIRQYLTNGGRALIAVDVNLKGAAEASPELVGIVKEWGVTPQVALVIDPISRILQLEPTVPIVATYSKENPITKEMQGNSIFPLVRPLQIAEKPPEGLKIEWLTQTTPNSWGETDFGSLGKGMVQFQSGDLRGPVNVMVAVDGKLKDSKATRNTRLVIAGSSNFANNQYSRFGNNLDLFANAVSWIIEDESLISIRAKDEGAGRIELTQQQGTAIFLTTVFLLPLLLSIAGIVIWVIRKKL